MIYIISPFSHENKLIERQRYGLNLMFTSRLYRNYISCINPITLGYPFYENHLLRGDAATWSFINLDLMRICTHAIILMFEGWGSSVGVKHEIDYFQRHNKPMLFIDQTEINKIMSGVPFTIQQDINNELELIFEVTR